MATTLEMLIEAVKRGELPPLPDSAPSMPLGVATPPLTGPPPPMPDAVPLPPADTSFVNQYAGPAPVAPVRREPSTLEKIGAVLSGIGSGPEYAAQLREERDRPIREYNAALERYQGRRAQGIEIDERRRERVQDAATRRAEAQAEREFRTWLQNTGVRSDEAKEQMRVAYEVERDARRAQEDQQKEARQFKKQIALQIDDRIKAYRDQGADKYAEELARNDFRMALEQAGEKVPPLSASAEKANRLVQAKLARALRLAQGGGGGGGSERAIVEVVDAQGQVLGRMPYSQIKFDNGAPAGFPGATLRFPQAQSAAPPVTGASPEGYPLARGTAGAPGAFQEALAGGIQMTTPGSGLTKQQKARFNDIKREIPGATDDQVLGYMRQKGWLK